MNYAEFERLMQTREVRIERGNSGLPVSTLSVRTQGSNVVGLYQVPQSLVATLMILGNWRNCKTWWKEDDKNVIARS